MPSQSQKYAQNWWGVTFSKSHTISPTRASLIPPLLPVCHRWGTNTRICMVCTKKETSLILRKVALLSAAGANTIGMHSRTPRQTLSFFFFFLLIFTQFSNSLPNIHGTSCSPVAQHDILSRNAISFRNKWQDMLTTVARQHSPANAFRLTFWDQFQSRVN